MMLSKWSDIKTLINHKLFLNWKWFAMFSTVHWAPFEDIKRDLTWKCSFCRSSRFVPMSIAKNIEEIFSENSSAEVATSFSTCPNLFVFLIIPNNASNWLVTKKFHIIYLDCYDDLKDNMKMCSELLRKTNFSGKRVNNCITTYDESSSNQRKRLTHHSILLRRSSYAPVIFLHFLFYVKIGLRQRILFLQLNQDYYNILWWFWLG